MELQENCKILGHLDNFLRGNRLGITGCNLQ